MDMTMFDIAKDAAGVYSDHDHDAANVMSRKAMNMIMERLPDRILMKVFSYLRHQDLGQLAGVCRKWRLIAYDSRLWKVISLRPDYSGLHVNNLEQLIAMIGIRFATTLLYIELPCDLITVPVIHELANRCPNLKHMTLDFSNAMQLHDFNELNAFPCNLYSLCICLSEVIFMEGFMRRIYSCLSSLQVLHLIGTFELSDDQEEEIYEVINISKIKSHTPNLRVVNLYGINFVDDSHIELLSSNCIHLECVALNFCLRVKGSTFRSLIQRCKKLRTLLLQHTSVEDRFMMDAEWENSKITELDLTSTELSTQCLLNVLPRCPGFTYLSVGYCEFFNDKVMEALLEQGKLENIKSVDISHTNNLSESATGKFLRATGASLEGLMCAGKPKLTEQFWANAVSYFRKMRICVIGTDNGWFLKLQSRIHIDVIMELFALHCPLLNRLEIEWDPTTLRYSDKSSKFIDHIRLRCPLLKSLTLCDGEYYEMVKSNFERADRQRVVRTLTAYSTSIVSQLSCYRELQFN